MEFPFVVNTSGEGMAVLIHSAPFLVVPYVTWVGAASVVGTFGNLLIIGTILSSRRRQRCHCRSLGGMSGSGQRPTGDAFILNLACSDLIVTAIINPFAIIGVTVGADFFTSRPGLCQALASVCVISCIASLLSIGCISVNRYIYICRQQSYAKIFTPAYSAIMCVTVWVVAALVDLPSLVDVGWSQKAFDGKSHKCLWDRRKSHSYTLLVVLGGMGAPLGIIVIFYTRIFVHMSYAKSKLSQYSMKNYNCNNLFLKLLRQARMMLVIFVAFSLCWLPYILVLAIDKNDTFPLWAHLFSSLVAHTHASLNFIIYGVANRKIRRSYRQFLETKVFCCCAAGDKDGHVEGHELMSPCHCECGSTSHTGGSFRSDQQRRALKMLFSRHPEECSTPLRKLPAADKKECIVEL